MFTIVNTVLLRPLPYPDSHRLVWMYGSFALNDSAAISPPDFLDYRDSNQVFSSMGATTIGTGTVSLSGPEGPEQAGAGRVSADLFATLGVEPILGRHFRAEEERAGAPPAVLLGHRLWRERFGGDPSVLGRAATIEGVSTTVVGVMPPGFRLPYDSGIGMASEADLWVPIEFGTPEMSVRRFHFLRAVGRLRKGVTLARAQAALDVVARRLEAAYPENESWKLRLVALHEHVVGPVQGLLLILQAVVAIVLLVACANVTSLMLARAEGREAEIGVRGALGASRARVLRQLLTESFVLSGIGAALGCALAYAIVRAFLLAAPAALPRVEELRPDGSVLLFAVATTVGTTLLCGLVPAWRLSRSGFSLTIKGVGRGAGSSGPGGFQKVLLGGQVAASVVLLIAAGLLVRSLWRMQAVPLGFQPEHVTIGRLILPSATYDSDEKVRRFFTGMLDHLRAEPGVDRAAAASVLPLLGGNDTAVHVEGKPPSSDRDKRYAQVRSILGDFFEALAIPILAGQSFDDRNPEAARRSIVINAVLAREFFGTADPIGRRLVVDLGTPTTLEVVGVAGDVREWGPASPAPATMYVSVHTAPRAAMSIAVRTAGDASALPRAVQRVARNLDKDLAVGRVEPMVRALSSRMAAPRLRTLLLASFAAVALVLTLVGLHGSLDYAVARRRREIGVRLALGADPGDVRRMIFRQGAALVAFGLVAGAVVAFGVTRLLDNLLFEVQPRDPAVFATVILALAGVGLVAVLVPARRATRVDPVTALREE
jgi:putative ABC transport system permease protein